MFTKNDQGKRKDWGTQIGSLISKGERYLRAECSEEVVWVRVDREPSFFEM
jgi:hypothetical protein